MAEAFVGPNITDNDLWRVFELPPGEHVLRLVTRPDADPASQGRKITLRRAVIYAPAGPR
jgi:hypothetical protein